MADINLLQLENGYTRENIVPFLLVGVIKQGNVSLGVFPHEIISKIPIRHEMWSIDIGVSFFDEMCNF